MSTILAEWTFEQGLQLVDGDALNSIVANSLNIRAHTSSRDVNILSTDFTVVIDKLIGSPTLVNLPRFPSMGRRVQIIDDLGDASINSITINGRGNLINGSTTALIIQDFGSATLVFNGIQWNVISGVSSGGGVDFPPRIVSSGITDVATAGDTFIAWRSNTPGNKTQIIPDGNVSTDLIIKDATGTFATYPATISSLTWTIDGQSSFVLGSDFQSVALKADSSNQNWMVY